jgi:hypothetical protein
MSDSKSTYATFDLLEKSTDTLAGEIGEVNLDDRAKRVKEPHRLSGTSASVKTERNKMIHK